MEFSNCLYSQNGSVFSGTPIERAGELMRFYRTPDIGMIFDVSGGDLANGVLPFLDYAVIRDSNTIFWGYSDLTTIINAIYAKTGRPSVLYQARNLTDTSGHWQQTAFQNMLSHGDTTFLEFACEMLRGDAMEGVVVGGNMRCLLKLAGTDFWPDMHGKILLLEAAGGLVPQMASCLAQLKLMGVLEQVSGILLGTFLNMEEHGCTPTMEELVMEYAGPKIPVAKTMQVGHRIDAHGVLIGNRLVL